MREEMLFDGKILHIFKLRLNSHSAKELLRGSHDISVNLERVAFTFHTDYVPLYR